MESIIIIISCSLVCIEKRKDSLQVTHTNRSWDQLVYPSSLALAKAAPASACLPKAFKAMPL